MPGLRAAKCSDDVAGGASGGALELPAYTIEADFHEKIPLPLHFFGKTEYNAFITSFSSRTGPVPGAGRKQEDI